MDSKKAGVTFWIIFMLTLIKIFSIIFICTLSVDIHKLLIHKQTREEYFKQLEQR